MFRIGQLGDTVVALPAMAGIRKRYQDSKIILITNRNDGHGFVSSWELLRETGIFSEVLFFEKAKCGLDKWIGLLTLAWRIRRLNPTTFFYLSPFPRYRTQIWRDRIFFRWISGIKHAYGLEATDKLLRLRDSHGRLAAIPSEADRLLSIVDRTVGRPHPFPLKAVKFEIPISQGERDRITQLWNEARLPQPNGIVVGIGPGSKMPSKRWPIDRFIEVGRFLLKEQPDAHIIVVGGTEDAELGSTIRSALGPRVQNWAGKLSVLGTAEALRRCAFYLGNDTGVMHLAAAVGTRCVGIFSARDNPGKWDPYGDGHIVLRKYVPCEGCLLVECRQQGMACLNEITIREVSMACLSVLNNSLVCH